MHGVVNHGSGGLGGDRNGGGEWYACGLSQGGWSHVWRCRGTSRVRDDTLMTPDHTLSWCAALGRVEPELVGLPGKALARDSTRWLLFVVHAAGFLHSVVLYILCVVAVFRQEAS